MSIMSVRDLGIRFGGLAALSDVSFDIEENEILGVIGPNGAGKTTLFNLITGFYAPTSGSVHYMERDISGLNSSVITKMGINRTFQNIRLFKSQTVLENVLVGMHNRIDNSLGAALIGTKKSRACEAESRERAMALLKLMNLEDVAGNLACNLSYGNQRRLELARALANEPQLLLLDEPTAGMNPQEAHHMIELVHDIRKRGMSILIIEHNMKVVMGLSHRIVVIEAGRKIAEGTPKEVQYNPDVIRAYLGAELE